jgi:hypothetical protein
MPSKLAILDARSARTSMAPELIARTLSGAYGAAHRLHKISFAEQSYASSVAFLLRAIAMNLSPVQLQGC